MKNKNKRYLILVALFFFSVFFVSLDKVNNIAKADCYDQCANDADSQSCFDACQATAGEPQDPCYNNFETQQCCSYNSGYWWSNGSCNNEPEPTGPGAFCDGNYETQECCTVNGGYWYNNTCNTSEASCDSYANTTKDASGLCQCNAGFVRADDGSCFKEGTEGAGYSKSTCQAAGGYWAETLKTCYDNSSAYCEDTMGVGYTMNALGTCTGNKDAECASNSDCAYGCSCLSGVCKKGGYGDAILGGCKETPPDPPTTGTPVAKTTAPTVLPNGKTAPAGSTVMSNGSVVGPNGEVLAPAGSIQLPTTNIGGGFVMCANGSLAAACVDIDGNPVGGGVPINPILIGTGGTGGFTPGTVGGVSAVVCGPGFNAIGGVCFPMNTGLANPQGGIGQILGNLFIWLMGLFTTLAVLAFVLSGIQYFLASGDESMAEKAKENAVNAIIGIIVGLSGFIIIKAISAALTGQSIFF